MNKGVNEIEIKARKEDRERKIKKTANKLF